MANRADPIPLQELVTSENFNEAGYLACNPDVKAAVATSGGFASGRAHFDAFGHRENRSQSRLVGIAAARKAKLARLVPRLKINLDHLIDEDGRLNFLTEALRAETHIIDTDNVSSNRYDGNMQSLIEKYWDGLILDCGAGSRAEYYCNVVNLEIVPYPSTDVLAVGEHLPFTDDSFDAVFSVAVLEHVRDPFRCAAEIARVLKPGGELYCCVPFLQPLHGYPHHYFNASPQGIRCLFENNLLVDSVAVNDAVHPIWALTWIVKSWADGLSGSTREHFLDLQLSDLLINNPMTIVDQPFCRELSEEKLFELACATVLTAHKP
jgi:SAM-dependent methyltransferase